MSEDEIGERKMDMKKENKNLKKSIDEGIEDLPNIFKDCLYDELNKDKDILESLKNLISSNYEITITRNKKGVTNIKTDTENPFMWVNIYFLSEKMIKEEIPDIIFELIKDRFKAEKIEL